MGACDDQSKVIAFLSQPGSYGISGPVEQIDTHAAIVFLAGGRAYKLKRAVRFPYLDFSTIAKRKAVCENELALNRRTAPDLYLDVECVGRGANGELAFGKGEPLDWVLVMRRFAPECLLDSMAEEGSLAPKLLRDLADGIAAFHERADVRHEGGGAARVREVIDGNLKTMAEMSDELLPTSDCERLHELSMVALETVAPLLDRRAAEGHVRHCHGDLHLANICVWKGQPTLFDCLEFDASLATTDTLYDLAFLLMDLWQRGLGFEASLVFNRYCDMSGDDEGLAAMPLFLSMRAAVRAHVSASAAERQAGETKRNLKSRAARRYLDAALDFLKTSEPRMIAVGGLSGTGKSTLAARLAPYIGHPPGGRWLRTDVLRKRMAGLGPEERLPPKAYTKDKSAEVYNRLLGKAETALAAGTSVILDGVFADPVERRALGELAKVLDVPFTGMWLDASPETMRERVGSRRGDASDADLAVVEKQLGYDLGDLSGWRKISAAGSPDKVLGRALDHLEGRGR